MSILPPLPPWEGAHPIIVHLPIGLLAAAPVFGALALLWNSRRREFMTSTLILLALGTLGTLLAVASGEAGESVAKAIPGARPVLHEHEERAELARNVAIALTLAAGFATLLAWKWHASLRRGVWCVVSALVLLGTLALAILVARAGHEGGRLVHEFGAHAPLAKGAPSATTPERHED